jgi:inhibitor of KinA
MTAFKIEPFGDYGVLIEWHGTISPEIEQLVMAAEAYIQHEFSTEIFETVIAYTSIAVYLKRRYSPKLFIDKFDYNRFSAFNNETIGTTFLIPVCYEADFGPDLDDIAAETSLTISEIIKIHTRPVYKVRFIGFLPGFPYLSGLDERLHMPRRASPRLKTAKGSVGIGGAQTGIYTMDSPGGWHVIGRSPLCFFKPEARPPAILKAGDRIKFRAISRSEFEMIAIQEAIGSYMPERIKDD